MSPHSQSPQLESMPWPQNMDFYFSMLLSLACFTLNIHLEPTIDLFVGLGTYNTLFPNLPKLTGPLG